MSEELAANQQVEISDIIEDFVATTPVEQTEVVEDKVETKPVEEVKESGEEGKERSEKEADKQEPITPVKEGEEKVEDAETKVVVEDTELEKIRRENLELKQHLEEMAGKYISPKESKPLTEQEVAAQKEAQANASKQILKFLPSDEVFDDVMKDVNNFNALLTSVVNTAVERSLRLMPQIATQLVDQQMTLKTVINDFYTDNKDLMPHRKYVGYVSNEIASQHPDWNLSQILQETEKEVRNRLTLARIADNTASGQGGTIAQHTSGNVRTVPNNPGFVPGGGGGRRGPSSGNGNLSVQEKGILDLIS